jgi:alpha-tubulin suppressor-like RCC1 family protein
VKCWGNNSYGECGTGYDYQSSGYQLVPATVPGLSGVQRIAAGEQEACALLNDGTAQCWGRGALGQYLGPTSGGAYFEATSYTPVGVLTLSGAVSIDTGGYGYDHTCAVLNNGTATCWGYNNYGQVGNGTNTDEGSPVPVSGLSNVASLGAGALHNCALLNDGTVKCWGNNSWYGSLGDGTMTDRSTPVAVSGLSGATSLSVGQYHACVTHSDGTAWCWGENTSGQLGDHTNVNRSTPVQVIF